MSARRARNSALMYARPATERTRMRIGNRYAMRESRRWRRNAQMMGSWASESLVKARDEVLSTRGDHC